MSRRSSPTQRDKAIEALLTCATIKDAADKVGIGERTLRGWLKEPAFAEQYHAARRQVFDAALGRLQGAASSAVTTLFKNTHCENPSVETRAAVAILELGLKGSQLMDLSEEIEALRRALKEKGVL
jgi:hypothetical protein